MRLSEQGGLSSSDSAEADSTGDRFWVAARYGLGGSDSGTPSENQDPLSVLTDLVPVPPPSTPSSRSRRPTSSTKRPFWRYGFPALIVLISVLILVLTYVGKRVVLQSTAGSTHLTDITDPTQPGYQAIAKPTSTLLLVQVDDNGIANGLTVLSLTGEGAGGLIFVPLTTYLELPDIGTKPLNKVAEKGINALQKGVEGVLAVGMGEVRIVTPQDLMGLVAPVGVLEIDNPDAVTQADEAGVRKVLFEKGPIPLSPSDVATYLATTNPGENDLNRLVRHETFWRAWLKKVGTSKDSGVVPGETQTGLGYFVRTLAADRVEMFPLPVEGSPIPGTHVIVYKPVDDQVRSLVARLVPFPIGAPLGARPRVRLLDATGKLDHGLAAAPLLVEGGGQIDQVGNATSFGAPTTQLLYYDDARRDAAEKLREAIGVGEVAKGTDQSGVVDVTVILGADFLNALQKGLTPVTTVQAGTATTTNHRSFG